jgi:hypothetical protein
MNFDPVIVLALRVPDKTGIGRHQLVNNQRDICLLPLFRGCQKCCQYQAERYES